MTGLKSRTTRSLILTASHLDLRRVMPPLWKAFWKLSTNVKGFWGISSILERCISPWEAASLPLRMSWTLPRFNQTLIAAAWHAAPGKKKGRSPPNVTVWQSGWQRIIRVHRICAMKRNGIKNKGKIALTPALYPHGHTFHSERGIRKGKYKE